MSVTLTPFAGLDNSSVENPEALYLVEGSGTDLDGKLIRAVALVDPTTAQAMGPGVTTIADGADVALGATTDTTSALTVVGRLKNLLSRWPAALTGSGNLKVAQQEALPAGANSIGGVTIADGASATLGTTTDASSTSTAIGLLKNLKAALAGTLATSVADGASVTLGTTTDTSSASTLVGLLKNVNAALAGTVATSVADGASATLGTTTDASSVSTVVGLLKNIKAALAGILSVKMDQTTPGSTNGVQVNAALPAGTNLLGKVGLDQTTPGTTNAVAVTTLPAPAAASAAALSSVAGSATTGTVLAANSARVGVLLVNDSTAPLYLAYAATATTSAYTALIAAGANWEMPLPLYKGLLSGLWASATGAARLTELT